MPRMFQAASLVLAVLAAVALGDESETGRRGLYGRRIVVETGPADKVTLGDKLHGGLLSPHETAEELAHWLEAMSGKKFEVQAAAADIRTSAIYLLRGDSSLVAASDRERLKDQGPEAFIIRGDSSRLQVIANQDIRGLIHGAYFYLERLGVRWLMAGAN